MTLGETKLFSLLKAKMTYHAERQPILAQNMANIDTPGYAPKDFKKPDFEKAVMLESSRLDMRATQPSHIKPRIANLSHFKTEEQDPVHEITPVENGVVLEEQMMKIAENKAQYDIATNIYKKNMDLFKIAIGKNS